MKIFWLGCLIMAMSVYCSAQLRMRIHFLTVPDGKILLYDKDKRPLKTFSLTDGKSVIELPGKDETVFFLAVAGCNEDRPLRFILSQAATIVQMDTLIAADEQGGFAGLYPNFPIFLEDPNHNQVFYSFQRAMNAFDAGIRQNSGEKTNDSLLAIRQRIFNAFLGQCDSLIKAHQNSFVAAVIINYLIQDNLLGIQAIQQFYNYLSAPVKANYFGLSIGREIGRAGPLQPGKPAPVFRCVDLRGEKYSLDKIQDKKILLHFWSSGCAPCIREAPELIRLASAFDKEAITLNVSNDASREQWLRGIAKAGTGQLIQVNDAQFQAFKAYDVNLLPTYYLIDQRHFILAKGTLEDMAEALGKPVSASHLSK